MNLKIFTIIIAVILFFSGIFTSLHSQCDILPECAFSHIENLPAVPNPLIGGLWKPHRTDVAGAPNDASVKVLLVFVQFKNETQQSAEWPIGGAPVYMDELLARTINTNGDYWNRYNQNTEMLSDWYQEVSKGRMHVTGQAYNIILDYPASHYDSLNYLIMNYEIIDKLNQIILSWKQYDKWSGSEGNFHWISDDYIDMIIKVHRTKSGANNVFPQNATGFACLGYPYGLTTEIPVQGGKIINDGYNVHGSGITIIGTSHGPCTKRWVFGIAIHELGHYLFGGGHSGNGVGVMGGDMYLGLAESMQLGYLNSTLVNFSSNPYTLGDITSRTSNGEILQVPITGPGEYFLISNRNKISFYDRTMLGDTARDEFDRITNYGQGIYIYHHADISNCIGDLECADGLFNWTYSGQTTPDWDSAQMMDVYEPTSIPSPLLNDKNGGTINTDGRSCNYVLPSNDKESASWFSRGKRHTPTCIDGTDRIYTNDTDYWTSRQGAGDRWDGWNIDYNQVFSPYSNPSTINWNNNQSGIFIYLESMNGTSANLNIYKVGENGMTEAQILQITPPSRPMGLKVDVTDCLDFRRYPILTWNHNMEPDMVNPISGMKRYKIYRAFDGINGVPGYYQEIADIQIRYDQPASYIDYNTYAQCSDGTAQENYRLRYRIKAIDIYESVSVYSDFVSISSYYLNRGNNDGAELLMGKPGNTEKPDVYSLNQNYPNPFNPVTRISYAIQNGGFVSLKVFDILGREVASLVNEVKTAGYYTVDFDASRLSSGIYFYKLSSGTYTNIKKMVLIK